jgi:putative phosphoesterase
MSQAPITIGVISDTHGLLRQEAIEALRESDLILHAGDVGDKEILGVLAQIAPITTVRGNVDTAPWAVALPKTQALQVGGLSIYMLHNIGELDLSPKAAGFRVVVYGHSHQPKIEEKNGVLFFNPGSAGPRRFTKPVTVGRLNVEGGEVRAEIIKLVE